jgi:hypothetical protein
MAAKFREADDALECPGKRDGVREDLTTGGPRQLPKAP